MKFQQLTLPLVGLLATVPSLLGATAIPNAAEETVPAAIPISESDIPELFRKSPISSDLPPTFHLMEQKQSLKQMNKQETQ